MPMKNLALLITIAVINLVKPVMATTHLEDVKSLTSRVDALVEEVTQLRKAIESLQAIQPTVTSLMPEFAERFHVMHFAGEAEDWAVAHHEFLELKRIAGVIKTIDPEMGALIDGFMTANFNSLATAIEHEKVEMFKKALVVTVESCNACHVAAGSPFMKVGLNVQDSLSMRHSHELGKSSNSGENTHMHSK